MNSIVTKTLISWQVTAEECTVSQGFKQMSCDKRMMKRDYHQTVQADEKQGASSQLVKSFKKDQIQSLLLPLTGLQQ